jgi:hypothetical protein
LIKFSATTCLIVTCLFFSKIACAQTVELYCKGNSSGDFGSEEREFSLNVSFAPADFGGIPQRFVIGCMDLKEKSQTSCTSSVNNLVCTCHNSIASTFFNLSRVTGRLTIDSYYSDGLKVSRGIYECSRISKRKF